MLLTPTGHQLVGAGRRPSKRCTAVRGRSGSMALAIVGQVGDFVPPPRRSDIRVVPLSRGCLLHPNVRQMRIMHPDIAFELSKQRTAVKRYIRECLSLVPRPTHALHLAPAIGPHAGICLPARHWPPRPRLALTARVGSSARWLGTLASDERSRNYCRRPADDRRHQGVDGLSRRPILLHQFRFAPIHGNPRRTPSKPTAQVGRSRNPLVAGSSAAAVVMQTPVRRRFRRDVGCFYVSGSLEYLHGAPPSERTFLGVIPMITSTNVLLRLLMPGLKRRLRQYLAPREHQSLPAQPPSSRPHATSGLERKVS